jgi:uncharacterized protein
MVHFKIYLMRIISLSTSSSQTEKQKIPVWILFILLADTLILCIPFHILFQKLYPLQQAKEIGGIIHGLIRIALCTVFLKKINMLGSVNFHPNKVSFPLYLLIPFIFPMVLAIPSLLKVHIHDFLIDSIWVSILSIILMALAEEFLIRGVVLSLLIKRLGERNLIKSVILSALLFSILHLINLYRWNMASVFIQMIIAFYFGVFFGALMLKTKNILFLGLIHGMINIFFNLDSVLRKPSIPKYVDTWQEIFKAILSMGIIMSPLFIIGFVIIRKMQRAQKNVQKTVLVQSYEEKSGFY